VGREGIEPPMSDRRLLHGSCAPWRVRPISGPGGAGPDDDASAVVKVLVAGLAIGPRARSEGVEPPAVCWRPRRHHGPSARNSNAHDGLRASARRSAGAQPSALCLPAPAETTDVVGVSTLRRFLLVQESSGEARVRASTREGCAPEQSLGEKFACHRRSDDGASRRDCQRIFEMSTSAPWFQAPRRKSVATRRSTWWDDRLCFRTNRRTDMTR